MIHFLYWQAWAILIWCLVHNLMGGDIPHTLWVVELFVMLTAFTGRCAVKDKERELKEKLNWKKYFLEET